MANKMTKKDWFEAIAKVVEGSQYDRKDEALAFITHEIGLLDNKSSKNTMTKTQKANVTVKALIKDALFEVAKPVTLTELMASSPALAAYTSQKISALISQMKKSGEIVRTEDKKKAYFSLAESD